MSLIHDDELAATVRAGRRWAGERDLPDPVKWADLVHAPAVTVGVIRGRSDGTLPAARAHTLPQPKSVGGELRPMTAADPFDEIVFRALVGRTASHIDMAAGDEVTSYRLVTHGPGWAVRHYTYARDLRLAELRERATSPDFCGLGTLDVRRYYPSIDPPALGEVLRGVGVADDVADVLVGYLETWQLWGMRGVPIVLEGSGLLGNAYLLPVDVALRAAGVEFGRYTDDYRLWMPAQHWQYVQEVAAEAVRSIGLELNQSKTRHMASGSEVLEQLTRPELTELRALLRSDRDAGLRRAQELFDIEAGGPSPDAMRLKFLLGVLRHRGDPYAVAALVARPELLGADPSAWGAYLSVLHRRQLLDVDWLVDVATAAITPQTAAAAYHLLRVCAVRRMSREHGRVLQSLATDNGRDWVPVRCAAAEAWGHADGFKPTVAADAALGIGDPQQRRALVLSMRHGEDSPARGRALRKLELAVPETRPAVQWIRDGHGLAA